MAELVEVSVLCYWNDRIEYGSNGVYYDRSSPRMIKVKPKTELSKLLDHLYLLTGLDIDDRSSKLRIFGRYPSVVQQQSMLLFLLLPVVNDASLETMLELPSKHPSIKNVELYLEVKSDGVVGSAACLPLLANPDSSSEGQRMDTPAKLEKGGNSNGWIEDEEGAGIGNGGDGDMTNKTLSSDVVAQVVDLTGDSSISHNDLNQDSNSGVSKPCRSSLSLDDNDLRVGLCFKDSDELKKAVDFDSEFEADEIERVVRVHPTLSNAEFKKGYELETSELSDAQKEAIEKVFGDCDNTFEDLPKLIGNFIEWVELNY